MPHGVASFVAVAAVTAITPACSATRLQSAWVTSAPERTVFKSIVALALTRDPGRRRMMEDALASELVDKSARLEAVASYTMLPDADVTSEARVQRVLALSGFDAAIVTRITDISRTDVFVPGRRVLVPVTYRTFWGYYRYWVPITYEPGYIERTTNVQVETQVFALPSGDLLYSALSRTFNPVSPADLIESVGGVVAGELAAQGWLARR
jgi:hypothetical protein